MPRPWLGQVLELVVDPSLVAHPRIARRSLRLLEEALAEALHVVHPLMSDFLVVVQLVAEEERLCAVSVEKSE